MEEETFYGSGIYQQDPVLFRGFSQPPGNVPPATVPIKSFQNIPKLVKKIFMYILLFLLKQACEITAWLLCIDRYLKRNNQILKINFRKQISIKLKLNVNE